MALPFFEDDLTKLYNDALSNKKTIPNEDLINLRNTFGVNPEFLLSDSNDYTMDAPIEVDDGIASIDTGLPIYVKDDNDNNFFQYSSMDGAPGYIRPTKIDAPVNSFLKGPEFYQNNAMTEKEYADRISKIREYNKNLDSSYTDEELREIINLQNQKKPEKTGILESVKNKGFDILDFIKGGGITGALAKNILGEQDPRATFLRDYYGGEDGSNLTSTGSIASGLMAGYNPVSGSNFLNKISGGFLPGETFGLQKSYTKRIDNIRDMLTDKYAGISSDMTDEELQKYMSTPEGIKALKLNVPNYNTAIERYFKLKEEREAEAAALRAAENRRLASQNKVRLGSNLIQDKNYRADPGLSRQGREQYTGPGMAFEKRNTGTGKGPR